MAILALPGVVAGQVKLTQTAEKISVEIDGRPFTDFYVGKDARKPYLHPLRTADGKIVTRKYPMENVEGESRDHPHHRGLWFTHGEVNGLDFWSNEIGQKGEKGLVVLERVSKPKSGKQQADIEATFKWTDSKGKVLLTEARRMTFYSDATLRTIDFDIVLRAVEEAKFGDTKEGTFAIRLADSMAEKNGGVMTSAEGSKKEKNVWGKQSPWVDYSGMVDGQKVGVAIFDHPSNPRHPTYWHSRAYGLFAANIFGLHDFLDDKTKDGSLVLKAGSALHFRYRVIIHNGDAGTLNVGALYNQWGK